MVKIILLFLIVVFCGCYPKLTQLQKEWPGEPTSGSPPHSEYFYAPTRNACIILKSNDTLCGIVKIKWKINPGSTIEILPERKKSGKDIIRVQMQNIQFIRVYSDSAINKDHYTDYFAIINKESFYWRLFAKRNDVKIYFYDAHASVDTNHYVQQGMVLITSIDTVQSIRKFLLINSSSSKILLKFIKMRYQQHFTKSDFKDEKAMADYILDKENERIHKK